MIFLLEKFSTFLILILTIILLSNNLIKPSLAQTNNNDVDCHASENPCAKVNYLLKPCNETLTLPTRINDTDIIQSVNYFVGNPGEAKCWCNKQFHDLLLNCTICLTSPTVNATVTPLDEYKRDCKKFGTEFNEQKQPDNLSTISTKSTKTPSKAKGPNKLLLALGISALITLLASIAFCLFVIRRKKKKSRVYEKLKSDYYSSKVRGRGIEIGGGNGNDEKELYSPSVPNPPMPPPLAHQPQQNEQQQQQQKQQQQQQQQQQQPIHSTDTNSHNFNIGIYGEQQYYVDASQAQVPTSRESYECDDNNNNNLSQQYVYQNYPK